MIPLAHPPAPLARAFVQQSFDTRIDRLMEQGAYYLALRLIEARLHQGLDDLSLLDRAATCYWQTDNAGRALEMMRALVAQMPDLSSGWTKLASIALSVGDRDTALNAVKTALGINPNAVQALGLRDRILPFDNKSARFARLKAIVDGGRSEPGDTALAMNILGRIEDRAGRTRQAFRWFAAANTASPLTYRPAEITAMVAAQILQFDPDDGPQLSGDEMPRMVFVTGMPRSGTTLAERILARHSEVVPLGENQALGRTVMAMRKLAAQRGPVSSAWDFLSRISAEDLTAFRAYFRSFLPPDEACSDKVLVSKMPLDCFDLGAAHMLLPHAGFVHMERHPLDVGLSCFVTPFSQGHGFARKLGWTGHMIRSVTRSSVDYEEKLGTAFRRQSYRHLVEDPETQIRQLLSHAGLQWQAACLQPQNGQGSARTASVDQVHREINVDGLGRWHRYRDHLAPLVEALGGWHQIRAWEEADLTPMISETHNSAALTDL